MPIDDQQAALEALYEHEGLTDNLTDDLAKALLAWAETQIKAGREPGAVQRAMRAANNDQLESQAAVVAAATAALPADPAPATDSAPATAQAAPEARRGKPVTAKSAQASPRQPSALERLINQAKFLTELKDAPAPAPPVPALRAAAHSPANPQSRRSSPMQEAAEQARAFVTIIQAAASKARARPEQANTASKATPPPQDANAASKVNPAPQEANEPKVDSPRRQKRRSRGKQRR